MKLTLPISGLIGVCNIKEVPGISAHLFNDHTETFEACYDKEVIHHISKPILDVYNPEATFYNTIARNNYCSCHLGMSNVGVAQKDYYYRQENKPLSRQEIKDKISEKIKLFRSRGIKNISLENCCYYPYPAYQYVCEPDFIREVIEENNVGFCFDIAHAIVSAWNMKESLFSYIKRLPLDRITEIHLSGHGIVGDEARDLHEVPGNNQFGILDKIINTWNDLKDAYVVVEYYRCFETLCGIYEKLYNRYNY